MRLPDAHFLAPGLRGPVPGEGLVEGSIQLAGGVVGDVQQRGLRVSGQGTAERQGESENSKHEFHHRLLEREFVFYRILSCKVRPTVLPSPGCPT